MGQILHSGATTTERIRKEIQDSKASISELARLYNLNRKTVRKWKNRLGSGVADLPCGGVRRKRCALSLESEQIILTFRKKTGMSLDDCFSTLKDCIPGLTRSNLHRCLVRAGMSQRIDLEANPGPQRPKGSFKVYPLGFVHMDIVEIQVADGSKLQLFTAIERLSKYAHARVYKDKTIETTLEFLKEVVDIFPFKIHRILTDNGSQFTYRLLVEHLRPSSEHPFDLACQGYGIKHKLTKFRHPWTNGQNERFNRTIKEETVRKFHYSNILEFKKHLKLFIDAYNGAKKLRAINHLTPKEKLLELYKKDATVFKRKIVPNRLGPNSYSYQNPEISAVLPC